jgi:hypothetical protein
MNRKKGKQLRLMIRVKINVKCMVSILVKINIIHNKNNSRGVDLILALRTGLS